MDTSDLRALVAAAHRRLPSDVDRLRDYVGHETPTGDAPALDALAERLSSDAVAAGMTATRVPLPTGDALRLDHPGRGPAQPGGAMPALLLAHHDTVHATGSLAGPVPLLLDGDVLRGPGTYDMKGGIVVALAALELLAELGLGHRPVRLLVTPDEEIGSPSSRAAVLAAAEGAAYALGLEAPHPDGTLKTSRRGSTRVRLTVQGKASHAAVDPGAGVSAIDELVDQLLAVRALVAGYPDVLCNVGVLHGGGRTNVVPDHADAELGLRFVTARTEREVLDRLAALAPVRPGAQVHAVVLSSRPAWEPGAPAEDLLARVQDAARSTGVAVAGRAAPGAADTNLTGAAGLPTLDGFGPLGGGAHAVTEHVLVPSIADRAALLAATLHLV